MGGSGSWQDVGLALSVPVLACEPASGRVALANAAACAVLNGEPASVQGKGLGELVLDRDQAPGGQSLLECLVNEARSGREAHRLTLKRLDGLELQVDCTPTLSEGGLLVLPMVVIHEEDAQDVRRDNYRLIFEHAPLGLFHFDAKGVITECNQNFVGIIGSSRQVLVGLDMHTLPDADLVHGLKTALKGEVSGYEGDYRSATAQKVTPVSVLFAPVVEDGRVTGGVGIVRDDTEARALRSRLAQADRLASLGTLAAGVAHEINNPLTYLITSLQTAEHGLQTGKDPHRVHGLVETALEGAERVRRIVRDLRMFSRTDETPRGPVDVHAVLEAALNLSWGQLRHRAEIERDFGDVPPVFADEVRLGQVFVNLLINAAQALPDDGRAHRVRMQTRTTEQGRVVVRISDNGVGIPPDVLRRAFEPFVTTKPVGVGTGLGLSICHGIISSLGGSIEIDSTPGEGTTVSITLQVAAGEAPQDSREPEPEGTPEAASILIVDDEPRVVESLRDVLSVRHTVAVASSAQEALPLLLENGGFDLVLCDVMMPNTSGLELYEAVRRLRPQLAERFAFMTGGVLSADVHEELLATGRPRLEKPFRLSRVERLLARN